MNILFIDEITDVFDKMTISGLVHCVEGSSSSPKKWNTNYLQRGFRI